MTPETVFVRLKLSNDDTSALDDVRIDIVLKAERSALD
jgi:hypothetical protein